MKPLTRMLKPALVICVLALGIGVTKPLNPADAVAADRAETNYPTFVLEYRKNNRWVDQREKEGLDALTRYAKRNKIISFNIVLPKNSDNNLYIERLLILSRIMKSRLRNDTIVFRQELGTTPANTISVTPSEKGTTTD